MKAETFLANLNARYRSAGGPSLHLLAQHVAEALEEVSEGGKSSSPKKSSSKKSGGKG